MSIKSDVYDAEKRAAALDGRSSIITCQKLQKKIIIANNMQETLIILAYYGG